MAFIRDWANFEADVINMSENTLLITGNFALRQVNGAPVYTEIKKEIISHSREFVETYGKHFAKLGLKLADRKQITEINNPINPSVLKRIVITPNGKGYISTYFLDFAKVHQETFNLRFL